MASWDVSSIPTDAAAQLRLSYEIDPLPVRIANASKEGTVQKAAPFILAIPTSSHYSTQVPPVVS
jgi:hypothetical protein